MYFVIDGYFQMYKIEYRDQSSGEVELSLMTNEKSAAAI